MSNSLEDHWKPNLFVAGFIKCGTTALCDYLSQHPDVYVIKYKEPKTLIAHLVNDIKSIYTDNHSDNISLPPLPFDVADPLPFDKYREWYIKNYKKIRVDGSVAYTYKIDFVKIVKNFAPNANIILCIREQKQRLISMYLFSYPIHRLTFDKWVDKIIPYIDKCLFHEYIVNYYKYYGNNLIIVDNQLLLNDPQSVMNKLFNFLNLYPIKIKPVFSNPSVINPYNDAFYNYLLSMYIITRYKFLRILKKTGLFYNISIYEMLKNIRNKLDKIIISYSSKKYGKVRHELLDKIPSDLKQILDKDYNKTLEFCRNHGILLNHD